jgi:hypothetical protein
MATALRCDLCEMEVHKTAEDEYGYAYDSSILPPVEHTSPDALKNAYENRLCPLCGEPMKEIELSE